MNASKQTKLASNITDQTSTDTSGYCLSPLLIFSLHPLCRLRRNRMMMIVVVVLMTTRDPPAQC